MLPFLIEDVAPRASRVPGGAAAKHPNGATGISRLLVAVRDAANAREALTGFIGVRATGRAPRPGRGEVEIATPDDADDTVERRLETLGPGPFAIDIEGVAGKGARIGFG